MEHGSEYRSSFQFFRLQLDHSFACDRVNDKEDDCDYSRDPGDVDCHSHDAGESKNSCD